MGNRSSKCCTFHEDDITAADSLEPNESFTETDRRAIAGGAQRCADYSTEEWATDMHVDDSGITWFDAEESFCRARQQVRCPHTHAHDRYRLRNGGREAWSSAAAGTGAERTRQAGANKSLIARAGVVIPNQLKSGFSAVVPFHDKQSTRGSTKDLLKLEDTELSRYPLVVDDNDPLYGFGCRTIPKRVMKGEYPVDESSSVPLPPVSDDHVSWSPGDASKFNVRSGPNYMKNGHKAASGAPMYDSVGCDMFRSETCKIDDVHDGVLGGRLPEQCTTEWSKINNPCLPRVLIINVEMPYQAGPKLFGQHPQSDHGFSVAGYFTISPEHALKYMNPQTGQLSPDAPPHLHLLSEFFRIGNFQNVPQGATANGSSHLFKTIGICENLKDLHLPSLIRPSLIDKYNGKPVLITKSGSMRVDPSGRFEWVEIDIDVRNFVWLAKSVMHHMHPAIPQLEIHVGFVIQAVDDSQMNENIIGCIRLRRLDVEAATPITLRKASGDDQSTAATLR
ncbi:putative ATP-dependent RNA helicase ddx43 [Perkinsus chesapeaki]|uniref:Putative ATP-dependent RNA helicase ddx43 n=1 Tax=Perkinsus chesapeaki TaxID=330153 RepID=A0A7J6L4F6_PERCH|nr:putative ATP-dependent RNA helicase ddx43 [Perkinsus chesapeaki]